MCPSFLDRGDTNLFTSLREMGLQQDLQVVDIFHEFELKKSFKILPRAILVTTNCRKTMHKHYSIVEIVLFCFSLQIMTPEYL